MSVHEAGAVGFGAEAPIDPPPVLDTYPLTPMQFGLAFESSVGQRPSANVEQVVCRFLDEHVELPLLEEAWRAVQRRHDVLRTTFEVQAAQGPVQHVHAAGELVVTCLDWTELDEAHQDDALDAWLSADRTRGVDLEREPGLRVVLLVLGDRRSTMVWTFHHALLDGRSFASVLEEVLERYEELEDHGAMAPRADPLRFRRHVEAVSGADPAAARAWFTELLAGHVDAIGPPGASPDTADPVIGARHREHEVRLPTTVVERLEARAAAADATVGSMLLAAWAVLLSRYSLATDVVFGTTRAGRHAVDGADDVIGCLINTVPIRLHPRPDATVDELLGEVRAFQLGVRPHEHTALVDIQSWSDVPSDQPLLGSNVVFERELLDSRLRARGGRWADRRVTVHEETSFPLVLAAYLDDGLLLRLEHDAARYRPEAAAALAGHLATLLRALADAGPSARVADLTMLTEDERRVLVDDRNPPPRPAVADTYVDRFERQVHAAPEHVAVEPLDGGDAVTYAQLDDRANRLAHVLVAAGASPAAPVAICLPRSVDFVVAALATLKAGAAYLPLDPTYPAAARAHMLDDAAAGVVVTSSARVPGLDARAARVVDLDRSAGELDAANPAAPARPALTPDDAAYVIYTSGSTGRPKGVVVAHGALVDFCDAVADRYGLVPTDRVLQFASLSFDVSVEELLPTLATGGTVVLRTEAMSSSLAALVEATEAARLTVLNLPSAIWHALVEHLEAVTARLAPTVRLVVVGGEKVARDAYDAWARIHPEIRWLNGYGPTETTVTCTAFDPGDGDVVGPGEELPIGRPLGNARAYVLDAAGTSLVPDGQVGELWIGGTGVAIGYLGQPELTDARFRPDPFAARPGARMYRTGDRSRWRPSGELEFHGRTDRQLKLRGFRIEPGEVERALEQHAEVRQAFVSLRAGASGHDRLVAWVTAAGDRAAVDPGEVLAAARRSLPAHAVPSALLVVDALARTPGGKVDVDALPAPVDDAAATHDAAAPVDDDEALLCRLFGDVLGQDGPVGVTDSFFELGGHSLLAVRLIGRIEAELGTRISLATLHAAPSPRTLAADLHQAADPDQLAYLSSIQPQGDRPPLYGIHVLGLNGSFYRPLAVHLGADQPVFGLSIAEPGEDTPTAVEEIGRLYADEIDRYQPTGPLSLAAISLGGFVAFEVAQQLVARGRQVAVLALIDSPGPGGRASVGPARRLAIHLRKLRGVGPGYLLQVVRRLVATTRERVDSLRVGLHRVLGRETPDELWLHRFVLANVVAAAQYEARPYPGPITVFHASGEAFDAPEAVRDGLGWADVAAGGLTVVEVPGEHVSMLEEPYVSHLAGGMRQAMDDALGHR